MPDPQNDNESIENNDSNGEVNEKQPEDLSSQIKELLKLNNQELESKVAQIKQIEEKVIAAYEKMLKTSEEQNKKIKVVLEKLETQSKPKEAISTVDDLVH